MDAFRYVDGALHCEGVPLHELAHRFGTPVYVYSRRVIVDRVQRLRRAFGDDAIICYAVKSNSNLNLLRLFADLGLGFDLVSGGELRRLQAIPVTTERAVFAGVAKQPWEVREAADAGILFFNVESPHELDILEQVAEPKRRVRVAVRLNPDVDAGTHDYTATGRKSDKFGMALATAAETVTRIQSAPGLELVGYHVHLGSQLHRAEPYLAAFDVVEEFWRQDPRRLDGVRYYDLGGGYGVAAGGGSGDDSEPFDVAELAAALLPRLARYGLTPVLEPGRFLIADAGVLVTEVLGTKSSGEREFALVDAAMNDLLRPALYQAVHAIEPVMPRPGPRSRRDIVGPVCESGDFLGTDRLLPEVRAGDLLSVFGAGAYGMSMASNYNTRRRAAEVLVDGEAFRLIRRRERFEELWATEVDL